MISFVAGSVYYSFPQVSPAIIGLVVDTIGEDRASYWLDHHAGDRLVRITPELGASLDAVTKMSDEEFLAEYKQKEVSMDGLAKLSAQALEDDFVNRFRQCESEDHLNLDPPETYEDELIVSEEEAELIERGDLTLPWCSQGSSRKKDYVMFSQKMKYPEFRAERVYSVPVIKGDASNLQDSLDLLTNFSKDGLERRLVREPLAGILLNQEGGEIARIGVPVRLTVRDWAGRKRFMAKGKVKAGPGKGRSVKRCVGEGTERDMPYNTRVEITAGLDGKFRGNSAVTYRRIKVEVLFGAPKGHIPTLKCHGLVTAEGRPKDMVDVILQHIERCGMTACSSDWVQHPLEQSNTHPGYFEGWIEANPESLAFVGSMPVLVQVF